MRADLWFPQIVWKDTLTSLDNAAIKAHVLETKNNSKGKTATNQLGWQSEDYLLDSGRPIQVDHMIRVLNTHVQDCARQGSLPPLRICNFWLAHTNFNITQSISEQIEKVDGVETLDIFTRYRFRIAIGKAFNSSIVMQNIQNQLCK